MVLELKNEEDFAMYLIKNSKCVIKFWAPRCVPCKSLNPVIENLSVTYSDTIFISVNVETFPNLSRKYFIYSLPTMLFMKDGNVAKQIIGNVDSSKISGVLQDLA